MNTLITILCCVPLIIFIIFALILTYQFYKLKSRAGKNLSEFLADFSRQVAQSSKTSTKPRAESKRKEEKIKPAEFEDAEFRKE